MDYDTELLTAKTKNIVKEMDRLIISHLNGLNNIEQKLLIPGLLMAILYHGLNGMLITDSTTKKFLLKCIYEKVDEDINKSK